MRAYDYDFDTLHVDVFVMNTRNAVIDQFSQHADGIDLHGGHDHDQHGHIGKSTKDELAYQCQPQTQHDQRTAQR